MKAIAFAILLFLSACMTPSGEQGNPDDLQATMRELLRAYTVAAVQVFAAEAVREKAPEAFRLIDKDGDGILSEAELMALDWRSPVTAVVVLTTVQKLIKHR